MKWKSTRSSGKTLRVLAPLDPVEFFQNPVRTGSGSELQNPVESRSENRIMFTTAVVVDSYGIQWRVEGGSERGDAPGHP